MSASMEKLTVDEVAVFRSMSGIEYAAFTKWLEDEPKLTEAEVNEMSAPSIALHIRQR